MVIYYIARFYSSFILSVACGKMRKNSCPNCPNCHIYSFLFYSNKTHRRIHKINVSFVRN